MKAGKLIAQAQEANKPQSKHVIAVDESVRAKHLEEKFMGLVSDKQIIFPKKLGAEHPFSFEDLEQLIKKVGLISGAVNKIKESIVGDFTVSSDNKNIDAILQDFVKNTNFTSVLREWLKEGILKGNGFMEIDLKEQRVQVLNANNMFVKRDKHGKIKEYNQFIGKDMSNGFSLNDPKQVTTFKPPQIAHLKMNKIANEPYGIGMVYPSERVIENLVLGEQDMAKLISRKAGAPIHVKVGQPGVTAAEGVIQSFANNLKFMNNQTEWVTDADIEMKLIDFSGITGNLESSIDHDMQMISAGMEIPAVLFGKANVPEGIAKVQLEAWQRKIASIREEVETIIVNTIFRPLLAAQSNKTAKVKGFEPQVSEGLAGDILFLWNLPGEEEKNLRLEQLNNILQNFAIDESMRRAVQLDIARILDLEGLDNILPEPKDAPTPEEEEAARKKEEEIPQPEVPGAKPTARASNDKLKIIEKKHKPKPKLKEQNDKVIDKLSEHVTIEEAAEMTIREYINLTELAGFNYSDYLIKILQNLKIDNFEQLAAFNEKDLALGLLDKQEIEKLRVVLRDGFRKNKTIREIDAEIARSVNVPDRFIEKDGKKVLSVGAAARPNMIARTETVRLANAGLKDLYLENKVDKYQYLAAVDNRTSDICLSLNGRIFNTADGISGTNMPPMHSNCRSTIVGVIE